jgi:hypothetical protein
MIKIGPGLGSIYFSARKITPTLINAVFVSGAGSEDANGLFSPDGTVGG